MDVCTASFIIHWIGRLVAANEFETASKKCVQMQAIKIVCTWPIQWHIPGELTHTHKHTHSSAFKRPNAKKKRLTFHSRNNRVEKKCHKFTCKPNETHTIQFLELSILFVVYAIQLNIYLFINSFCKYQSACIHFFVNNIFRKIIFFFDFFSLFKLY